jgi:hypothetical protein
MLSLPIMSGPRRLLAGFTCATAFTAGQAHAQPSPPAPPPSAPETLETPYEDAPVAPLPSPAPTPPSAPAPSATPAASSPTAAGPITPVPIADIRPLGPIRARRRLALTGEIGWNGLAGFGPVLTYHVTPHFSVDLGGGLSLLGWKAGARGRYNFMTTPFTPFVGAGVNATSGLGEITIEPNDRAPRADGEPNSSRITLDVKPSYLVQAVVGFDFIHKHGFTLLGCLGASILLNKDNVDVLAGTLENDEEQAIEVFFKSGPVISMAAGYAFQ